MFALILSKLIGQLLLPPAGLILMGLVGVIGWRRRWGRGLVLASLVLFWLLAISPVRDALLAPLEHAYPPLATDADLGSPKDTAIVLFGGGIYARAPEYGGADALHRSALSRTVYAADLALRTGLSVYPSGGESLKGKAEPEGRIMRRWLLRLGLPADHVVVENRARTTWQNAVYLKALLDAHGIKRAVLVTSAWHMPRAVWSLKAQGITVIPAPCDYVESRLSYDVLDYVPQWQTLAASGEALHEYLGWLWYHLRYGWLAR